MRDWGLAWQTMMDLGALFRRLYEDPEAPMPDPWRVLRLTMLPKVRQAQELKRFRGISLCSDEDLAGRALR